ncbi:MAG TPA: branched-chain amino acid ABC transporter permease [Gaiellaceae bacterium]|nr:branched-chain amino acid ABC transporter permease [Gaiellaceae bacterium]
MSISPGTPDVTPPGDPAESRIGVDSWVAESAGRRARGRGPAGLLARGWEWSPDSLKLLVFVGLASTLPFWLNEGDLFNFGLFTLLYVALALGLNVVVGFTGLLDLGFVAYLGIGAYTYALLSSSHYGIHWPAEATIPISMAVAAIPGLILGSTSRRLEGDYYAIVTLFFLQAFGAFTNTANPTLFGKGLTGGPNGIPNLDPLTFFGYELNSTKQQYFFLLLVVAVVAGALHFINQSRTGRAWRALREDPLAAEVMSIPVYRLKVLSSGLGAAIAGLCGAIFAATFTAVTAGSFGVALLILLYAMIILGGLGSIAGVILGGFVINISSQFLAPQNDHPDVKRWLFYGTIVLIVALMKPWYRAVLVLAGTIAFGYAVHAIVSATTAATWTSGAPVAAGSRSISQVIQGFVVMPHATATGAHGNFNTWLYVGLVVAAVVVRSLSGWWRLVGLVPTLYLTAMVWENILAQNPSVTALILFGAMLIALMTVRPQGLLGSARVEIV